MKSKFIAQIVFLCISIAFFIYIIIPTSFINLFPFYIQQRYLPDADLNGLIVLFDTLLALLLYFVLITSLKIILKILQTKN